MTKKDSIKLFEEKKVRTVWDEDREEWYFSVVDVVGILTESPDPRNYWKVLKNRLIAEGNETVTNCNQLKLLAADGKKRMTDVADTQQLFRLIQSIPSPKAEPFKLWIAQVAKEARLKLEAETGKAVVMPLNAKAILQIKESNNKI
jgi:prophage antirepressor-like protein